MLAPWLQNGASRFHGPPLRGEPRLSHGYSTPKASRRRILERRGQAGYPVGQHVPGDSMPGGTSGGAGSRSLMVFDGAANRMVTLPGEGTLEIGSAEGANLRLVADGVAPRHARLRILPDRLVLEPLDPAADLRVNDLPVTGPRDLWPWDVLALGEARIEYRDSSNIPHPVCTARDFHVRLHEEIERCRRRRESLAVLLLTWSGPGGAGEVAEEVARRVRLVDVVGVLDEREVGVLLPGTGEEYEVPARRLLRHLGGTQAEVRIGAAFAPRDGIEAGALLAAARFASRRASPGEVQRAGVAARRVPLGSQTLVIADPSMHRLFELVQRLAASDLPVLVTGETGVGKELVALALHEWSGRKGRPFVPVNCAAIADTLFESELFGHERGAFTDARTAKPGLLETASGGTLLLDEVGELSPQAQAKLLRVIETMRVCRIGSVVERAIDVRVIAASNRDLSAEVQAGRFRRDLYYRLAVASVHVPPLRERPLDIPALCEEFLSRGAAGGLRLSDDALRRLLLHDWPGNVRELRHVLAYCAATVPGPILRASDLPPEIGSRSAPWLAAEVTASPAPGATGMPPPSGWPREGGLTARKGLRDEIRRLEESRIREALLEARGVRVEAARILGMPLRTLQARIREYGLDIPSSRRRTRPSGEGRKEP